MKQESNRPKTMEDTDRGLHPAMDGQSLGKRRNNNNNDNNNNNNINAAAAAAADYDSDNNKKKNPSQYFSSLLTAPQTVTNTDVPAAWTKSCANHVQHIEHI